ncbi:hypothetical protein [Lactobacillus phage Lbab1]|jgi:hypothetical protein|nr:hypothetical protein [Lactobacillus phage Lbab1]
MTNIPDEVRDWIRECQNDRISLAMALVRAPASRTVVWNFLAPNHLDADQYEDTIDFDRANEFAEYWLKELKDK